MGKYLIVGLGNIGLEYEDTRHNIGFMIADAFAQKRDITFESGRMAFTAECRLKNKKVTLIKPTTFMNLSGKAVLYWLNSLKIPKENLIVILDDLALPFGTIRLRKKGSNGGHNGLKDIDAFLNTNDYSRLRFGIGSDFAKGHQANFVLSPFNAEERATLPERINASVEALETFVLQDISVAMTQYNGNG